MAGSRDQSARKLECLERALDAEYRDRPEVMRQDTIDEEYRTVLNHLQNLGEAIYDADRRRKTHVPVVGPR